LRASGPQADELASGKHAGTEPASLRASGPQADELASGKHAGTEPASLRAASLQASNGPKRVPQKLY